MNRLQAIRNDLALVNIAIDERDYLLRRLFQEYHSLLREQESLVKPVATRYIDNQSELDWEDTTGPILWEEPFNHDEVLEIGQIIVASSKGVETSYEVVYVWVEDGIEMVRITERT